MPTLILTPRYTADAQTLWRAAGRKGWDVQRLTAWRVPENIRTVDEPVLYLESLFGPHLAEEFGLELREPPDDWLPRLPEEYRKRSVRLATLDEARRLDDAAFVKPPNDKRFPALVYRGDGLPREFPDDMPVLIGEVVEWEAEFRCFVLDRRVVTHSVYSRAGELQRDAGFAATEEELAAAAEFAQTVLDDARVELPRATVLDVGVIPGRGWAVVEQNAAWGAGIYGCDPERVLDVLRHAAQRG